MSKPETVFKVGAVRASVFRNIIEKAGQTIQMPKVVVEVRYKDKTGQWQGTNSLSLNDLPKAILALQKAYEYLMEHKEPEQSTSKMFSVNTKEFEFLETLYSRDLDIDMAMAMLEIPSTVVFSTELLNIIPVSLTCILAPSGSALNSSRGISRPSPKLTVSTFCLSVTFFALRPSQVLLPCTIVSGS